MTSETTWLTSYKSDLFQLVQRSNLPHALIFTGVTGAGKSELSRWLANVLLCENSAERQAPCQQCKQCHLIKQTTHPDLMDVERTSNHVGVEQVRQVSRFLEKTAQLAQNQVAVVHDADTMTESAANALLKTLEEPTANSYVFLIASDEQRLLPTIISRCRVIGIRPPVGDSLLAFIGMQSQDPFINLTHLPELSNTDLMTQYESLFVSLLEFLLTGKKRMSLFEQLKNNVHGQRWLEKIISDLARTQCNWSNLPIALEGIIDENSLKNFLNSNRNELWQIYLLIKNVSKKALNLTQFNIENGIEKLLVDIQMIIHSKDK